MVAILIAGIVVLMLLRPPPQERRQVTRFTITTPQSAPLWITRAFNDIAISPDGTHVAYVCQVGTRQQLCLRPVDQLEATCFPSTGGSILFTPFFSPDGKEIGFYADSDLKKVSVRDGQATTLRADSPVLFGAVWAEDGTILYGSPNQELHRIPDSGGDPVPLSILDRDKQERAHVWPELLPGGKAILVTILAGWNRQIALLDPVTHEHRVLFLGSNPHYSPGGHIVYSHEGKLWAVAFDPEKLVVTGVPIPVLENLETKPNGAANFCLSDEGTLVYIPQRLANQRELVSVDRKGKEYPLGTEPRPYSGPRISSDDKRVALQVDDPPNPELWFYDIERDSQVRLTHNTVPDRSAIWTPDGERVVFSSTRNENKFDLYRKKSDGTGEVELLASEPGNLFAASVSADGLHVLFSRVNRDGVDIGVVSVEGERTQKLILHENFKEHSPEISPNGKWMAYQSDESDQWEIYVRPFPEVNEGKWKVSNNGGSEPGWAPDGRELFYRDGDRMMVVPIRNRAKLQQRDSQSCL